MIFPNKLLFCCCHQQPLGDLNGEDELSYQEPHELSSDHDAEEVTAEISEEEDSVDGIPTNFKTVWETGKLEK